MSCDDALNMTVERCELCDLIVGECEHTRVRSGRTKTADNTVILVSPSRTAHIHGCHHNDETELSNWGEWTRLGNGEKFTTNAGAILGRLAEHRCSDCEDHYPTW